ncbi:hypothetical protein SAMN05421636_10335 [Pricia antarctica]|uniref:Uncharacterized protein n=1 Tax=Pricia antarctica TaxID=641691 RepID=A0A1G6ZRT9_9FLAO|nr:hypothetical protein SAMN05421636_10335 [Pricia antarctica]
MGKKIAMKKKINIGFPISISNIRFLFRNKSFSKKSVEEQVRLVLSFSFTYDFHLNSSQVRQENISLTFSKKDLSDFSGLGSKLSSPCIRSKNSFCSLFSSLGVHTLTCTNKSPVP